MKQPDDDKQQEQLEQPQAAMPQTDDSTEAPQPTPAEAEEPQADEEAEAALSALQKIKENVREDDPRPTSTLTLRKILGGDILTAEMVRSQIWLIVLVVTFVVVYIAFRYQCQQDMIAIDKLEKELTDMKYKALNASSTLTERSRESRVLDILKQNKDSLLHIADQPPYIISVPDE